MNRGFLYGDGFFETIRIINSQIPLLPFHLSRMEEAIDIYKLKPQFVLDADFLNGIIRYTPPNCILRINFYRDGVGKYAPESSDIAFNYSSTLASDIFYLPTRLNLATELELAPKSYGSIAVSASNKPNVNWLQVKSLSSIFYVLAALEMQNLEAQYLVLKNDNDEICEELSSNLLFIKGEQIIIPSRTSGGINGATQRYIFQNYKNQIDERIVHINEIDTFDAIFICKGTTGLSRIK